VYVAANPEAAGEEDECQISKLCGTWLDNDWLSYFGNTCYFM